MCSSDLLVEGILLFSVVRFRQRRRDDALPKQVAGNTYLEIGWTLVPAMILAFVAVPTVRTIFDLSAAPEEAERLEVRVIAKQYWWEFEYLGDDGQGVVTAGELHIPVDRPVFLQMEALSAVVPDPGEVGVKEGAVANGVIHSFWVPRLAGKQDVVPGHVRTLTIQANEPGEYSGQCAEFCGLSHARMRFTVVAHEPQEFQAWLEAQAQPAAGTQEGLAAEGRELFETEACITCHAIRGYQTADGQEAAPIRIAPDLTHFASRERFAGASFDVTEENLKEWLDNPPAMKAGVQMPDLQLTEEQIDALTAYLLTLE